MFHSFLRWLFRVPVVSCHPLKSETDPRTVKTNRRKLLFPSSSKKNFMPAWPSMLTCFSTTLWALFRLFSFRLRCLRFGVFLVFDCIKYLHIHVFGGSCSCSTAATAALPYFAGEERRTQHRKLWKCGGVGGGLWVVWRHSKTISVSRINSATVERRRFCVCVVLVVSCREYRHHIVVDIYWKLIQTHYLCTRPPTMLCTCKIIFWTPPRFASPPPQPFTTTLGPNID